MNYQKCTLTRRGGDVSPYSYTLALFRLKGIWSVKSWTLISFGLNDVEWFRLGCIWKANSSDLNQRCYELGSRIILFWIVDLEPKGIKVAEHYVAV